MSGRATVLVVAAVAILGVAGLLLAAGNDGRSTDHAALVVRLRATVDLPGARHGRNSKRVDPGRSC